MTSLAPHRPVIGVVGAGVTGSRVVAHLAAEGAQVAVYDQAHSVASAAARRVKGIVLDRVQELTACDVVVLCQPAPHLALVGMLIDEHTAVVSLGDDLDDIRSLVDLHDRALHGGVPLVIGAGMAPGLAGLLARFLSAQLHTVDELHVSVHGTAGPACARQHHDALGHTALGWHDGEWIEPPGGSGRDLVWFPEPVQAHDCYRAAVADPLLLHRSFPGALRISSRVSATRRDRLTARLPMLAPPHATGDLGAVRVELRGSGPDGERITVIAGSAAPTADLAAAVGASTTMQVAQAGLPPGCHSLSDVSLVPLDVLHHATRLGVRVQEFTGVGRTTGW
jgi:hypothetical protein